MILDKKGKLFGKISIVDIIIAVIIIAAIAGLYYKFGKSGTVTAFTKTDNIQITLYHEDVPNYIANNIKVGDVVKDRLQNAVIGKVTDVKVGPDIVFHPSDSGQVVASSRPGYSSITVTAEGKGIYNVTGPTFGGVEYYLGKQVEWRVGVTDYFAKISDIKKVKE